jgi:hypothetical protein
MHVLTEVPLWDINPRLVWNLSIGSCHHAGAREALEQAVTLGRVAPIRAESAALRYPISIASHTLAPDCR